MLDPRGDAGGRGNRQTSGTLLLRRYIRWRGTGAGLRFVKKVARRKLALLGRCRCERCKRTDQNKAECRSNATGHIFSFPAVHQRPNGSSTKETSGGLLRCNSAC